MSASQYIDIVESKIGTILNQIETITKAGDMIAGAVLGGNRVFVIDSYRIIETEIINRSSGLALFRSFNSGIDTFSQGDVLLLSAFHPDNETDLNTLNRAHSSGTLVITVSPEGKLSENADIALLNSDDPGNGVITIPYSTRHLCPISGTINAAFAWAIAAETTSSIMNSGEKPTVYYGEYLKDGAEKLSQARNRFLLLGY